MASGMGHGINKSENSFFYWLTGITKKFIVEIIRLSIKSQHFLPCGTERIFGVGKKERGRNDDDNDNKVFIVSFPSARREPKTDEGGTTTTTTATKPVRRGRRGRQRQTSRGLSRPPSVTERICFAQFEY
jgi:hypothetical protein